MKKSSMLIAAALAGMLDANYLLGSSHSETEAVKTEFDAIAMRLAQEKRERKRMKKLQELKKNPGRHTARKIKDLKLDEPLVVSGLEEETRSAPSELERELRKLPNCPPVLVVDDRPQLARLALEAAERQAEMGMILVVPVEHHQ